MHVIVPSFRGWDRHAGPERFQPLPGHILFDHLSTAVIATGRSLTHSGVSHHSTKS